MVKSPTGSTSKSGFKARSPSKGRAQPRATTRSKSESRSQPISSRSRSKASTKAISGTRLRSTGAGSQSWLARIETMLTSQQGRELMADALRAVANVLDKHRQQPEPEARSNQTFEAGQQSLGATPRSDEPASAAGMDRGADAALDVQLPLTAAGEQADAMTSMQTGLADAQAGTDGQGSGKRRSSRKKAAEGPA